MDLVVHHVLETLVISWTQENLSVQLSAREAIVQDLQEADRRVQALCNNETKADTKHPAYNMDTTQKLSAEKQLSLALLWNNALGKAWFTLTT